jgi:transposase
MNKRPGTSKSSAERLVKTIRRKTWQTYSSEEKIRIVLAGLRVEETISVLCCREGISESLYYSWSKEFSRLASAVCSAITALLAAFLAINE